MSLTNPQLSEGMYKVVADAQIKKLPGVRITSITAALPGYPLDTIKGCLNQMESLKYLRRTSGKGSELPGYIVVETSKASAELAKKLGYDLGALMLDKVVL